MIDINLFIKRFYNFFSWIFLAFLSSLSKKLANPLILYYYYFIYFNFCVRMCVSLWKNFFLFSLKPRHYSTSSIENCSAQKCYKNTSIFIEVDCNRDWERGVSSVIGFRCNSRVGKSVHFMFTSRMRILFDDGDNFEIKRIRRVF